MIAYHPGPRRTRGYSDPVAPNNLVLDNRSDHRLVFCILYLLCSSLALFVLIKTTSELESCDPPRETQCMSKSTSESNKNVDPLRSDAPTAKVEEHLTVFTETSPEVVQTAKPTTLRSLPVNPYIPAEVLEAITRDYLLTTFSWASSDAVNAVKLNMVFPFALINFSAYLQDKMKWYGMMRGAIELTFRINCTAFEFGSLMIAALPYYHTDLSSKCDWRLSNIFAMSGCDPIILEAQDGASCTVTIPWMNPNQLCEINTTFAQIGQVVALVLHPLASCAATPMTTVNVAVYAHFKDPELVGYVPGAAASSAPLRLITGQSFLSPETKEAKAKSQSGVISGLLTSAAPLLPLVTMAFPEVAAAVPFLGTAIDLLGSIGLDKPTSVAETKPVQLRWTPNNHLMDGLANCQLISAKSNFSLSTAHGLFGDSDPRPKILEMIMRPILMTRASFTNSISPNALIQRIPVDPNYLPVLNHDADYFKNFYQPGMLMWYAQRFSFFRGGLKYLIKFCCSKFTSCRVRISHILSLSGLGYDVTSGDTPNQVIDIHGSQDVMFMIPWINTQWCSPSKTPVDVTTTTGGALGWLDITLVTPIACPDATPTVYYSVWVAAAEDFQFVQPIARAQTLHYETWWDVGDGKPYVFGNLIKGQSSPNTLFKKPFPGLVSRVALLNEDHIVSGERIDRVTDLLKRYVTKIDGEVSVGGSLYNYQANPASVALHAFSNNPGAPTTPDSHSLDIAPFMFSRSNWRYSFMTANNVFGMYNLPYRARSGHDLGSTAPTWTSDLQADGYIAFPGSASGSGAPYSDVEYPYYDYRAFLENIPTMDVALGPLYGYEAQINYNRRLYAAGDNLLLGYPTCPPMIVTPDTAGLPFKPHPNARLGVFVSPNPSSRLDLKSKEILSADKLAAAARARAAARAKLDKMSDSVLLAEDLVPKPF